MGYVVPFDGSELSEAALARAARFGNEFDRRVVAVVAVPQRNAAYARNHGWLSPEEAFDLDTVLDRLREQVESVAPDATFSYLLVDRHAPSGTIANRIRRFAREEATTVFVGSENAGRVVSTIASVGSNVAADVAYDVFIVRSPDPIPEKDPEEGVEADAGIPPS